MTRKLNTHNGKSEQTSHDRGTAYVPLGSKLYYLTYHVTEINSMRERLFGETNVMLSDGRYPYGKISEEKKKLREFSCAICSDW